MRITSRRDLSWYSVPLASVVLMMMTLAAMKSAVTPLPAVRRANSPHGGSIVFLKRPDCVNHRTFARSPCSCVDRGTQLSRRLFDLLLGRFAIVNMNVLRLLPAWKSPVVT